MNRKNGIIPLGNGSSYQSMFSLAPQYYSYLYYAIVTIMSLLAFLQYGNYSNERFNEAREEPVLWIVLLTLMLSVFIGLRPVSAEYFVDMDTYDQVYTLIEGDNFVFATGEDTNLLFDNLFAYMATHEIPSTYFFLIISLIYFIGISWACCLFFPKDKFASILVYLSAFSTFAYGTNGIKAGAAASLFLVAVALYERRQWVWVVILMLLSMGCHHAMILPLAAFIGCLIVKNPKIFLGLWVVCFFISLFHITIFQEIFARLVNEHGAEYLLGAGEALAQSALGGFRIDFIVYSVIPIVVGVIAIEKKQIESENYIFLLNLYTLINAVWLLCMYSEFTNRIAYLSWMLYPIVLIYPFLNEEWEGAKYRLFQWVAYLHLVFNLFMEFIYW